MSKYDNYSLPKSRGTSFPHEDDIPRFDRGTRDYASLPPPPSIILPNPQVRRLEKFKITQALLASKHEEGKSVCAHVLEMKSHIDRLRMLGSVVCEELAVDWVLQSLPNSYSEFVREYYMMNVCSRFNISYEDINRLPRSYRNVFPQSSGDGLPLSRQSENVSPSLGNGGNVHRLSSTLPPPPLITLPMSHFPQVERYETTQALLACKNEDGNFVYHVLKMKSYIDKFGRMGFVFPREQANDLVLLSLPELYGQFIRNFHIRNLDVTLIDLNYMLMVAEAEMLKHTTKEEMLIWSNSKNSMEINNGNINDLENISLPNRKGSVRVKPFDRMVKIKARSEIIPHVEPDMSVCFSRQLNGH
ncbi:hypothetical protein Lser_V15G01423 [Lactuca serriola]